MAIVLNVPVILSVVAPLLSVPPPAPSGFFCMLISLGWLVSVVVWVVRRFKR